MSKQKLSIFESPIVAPDIAAPAAAPVPAAPEAPSNGTKRTVVYMPVEAFEILRDAAHHERCSINDILLQGVDHVLKVRSHPSTKELRAQRDK